jgi:hypothetical protein
MPDRKILRISAGFLQSAAVFFMVILLLTGCTKEKVIVYRDTIAEIPGKVTKMSPVNGDTVTTAPAVLVWRSQEGAVEYEVQVDNTTSFYSLKFDTTTADTTVSLPDTLSDDRYYWRVRAGNDDGYRGDWSDESIWNFLYDVVQSPVRLASQIETYGYPNDVTVVNERNRAYVADGLAQLTVVDITDKNNPSIVGNLNMGQSHDISKGIFIAPDDSFAYIADMDGNVQILKITEPLDPYTAFVERFGPRRNVEDVTGLFINDTLFIIAVGSVYETRLVGYYQIPYIDGYPIPGLGIPIAETFMYADCNGLHLSSDSNYVLIANDQLGLQILDISDLGNFSSPPGATGSVDLPGNALSVDVVDTLAYVAADHSGLWIINIADPASPEILSNFDTSGRTKDVEVVDSLAFLADGAGGLKVINVADPLNPTFISSHDTHYAYGIWADTNYVYLTDRDLGLLIFEIID